MTERVGFVPEVPAPINDLGPIGSSQSAKSTQNLSIRYKTGTGHPVSQEGLSAPSLHRLMHARNHLNLEFSCALANAMAPASFDCQPGHEN